MRRPLVIVLVLFLGVGTVFVAAGFKRVPPDHQAVLVDRGQTEREYGSGVHFVFPFTGRLVTYPVGRCEVRLPAEGEFAAITRDGFGVSVALRVRLRFSPDQASSLFESLGEDYIGALSRLVGEAIEIETARYPGWPGQPPPNGYANEALVETFRGLGASTSVALEAFKIERWEIAGDVPTPAVEAEPLARVVFVGVDGADWDLIDRLIGSGRLPNFRKLVEEGATGPLESIEPLLSPLIWTTMATGKLPEDHGVLNFTVVDPETGKKVPINRLYRKVDAFWNMLGDYDRSVDIVGWLATFPAESINGVMVTDRVGYLAYAEAGEDLLPEAISPGGIRDEIAKCVVKSTAVSYEEFRRFAQVGRNEFERNRALPFDPKNPLNDMIMLYASTQTYRRMAAELWERDHPDFLAVYFELVDATKHLFMQYAPPKQDHVDDVGYEKFKNAVDEAYVLQDEILGEILEKIDEKTVLFVASDHGFKSGERRPTLRPEIWAGKAAFWHEPEGIVCLYGPGIRRGHRIEAATILDITPTILALAGLPKPADMPGSVLEAAFTPELAARLNRTAVPTLERTREAKVARAVRGDEATDQAMKKLEALGYITPENPDRHNNLGQRYQQQGQYEKAIAEFQQALALRPNFPGALNNLGVCYGKLKRYDEAAEAFERALTLNPADVYAMNNLAIMYLELGQFERARRYGERSVEVEPNYSNGHLTLGSVYATIGELELAERQFERSLELDPSNDGARANLERVRAARNK